MIVLARTPLLEKISATVIMKNNELDCNFQISDRGLH